MEIKIVKKVLSANDTMAQQNREYFSENQVFVLNLMSSPGSGKTSILEKTINKLLPDINSAIIVGDICTTNDADRLAKTGVSVIQICTDDFGGDCHLAAHVVGKAASDLDLEDVKLLIVENVGNLVCPAEFDIGEDSRVVVLSVTEGEDKPLKYPLMFRVCDAALLNKTDLLPYLEFDIDAVEKNIRQIHPDMPVFNISAKTEDGFSSWIDWLKKQVESKVFR
jgi:hydrogenase nickel incorporation protein HypB